VKDIIDTLIYRLSDKGITPLEIPRLIRDVLNTISDDGEFTLKCINQKLSVIGWGEQILDEYLLELILRLLEMEAKEEMVRHNVQ
jgi:hypothetical protein